eukprot:GEMP01006720.1.p1 GENE.GEMP01006720.1~~GEMP01006720.1.p1  ORF type:complete len:984 (+),score=250.60 GEMP01006720.1:209-3160(+)
MSRRLSVSFVPRNGCFVTVHPSNAADLSKACVRLGPHVVGWRADPTTSPLSIEMSTIFAECLGVQEGERFALENLGGANGPPTASQVFLQPLGIDDFEVIEAHPSYIEEHLLSQIWCVQPNMLFPVWIYGAVVKLRVVNLEHAVLLDLQSELCIESSRRQLPKAAFAAAECTRFRVLRIEENGGAPCIHVPVVLPFLLTRVNNRIACVRYDNTILAGHCCVANFESTVARFTMVALSPLDSAPVMVPKIELHIESNANYDASSLTSKAAHDRAIVNAFRSFVALEGELPVVTGSRVTLTATSVFAADEDQNDNSVIHSLTQGNDVLAPAPGTARTGAHTMAISKEPSTDSLYETDCGDLYGVDEELEDGTQEDVEDSEVDFFEQGDTEGDTIVVLIKLVAPCEEACFSLLTEYDFADGSGILMEVVRGHVPKLLSPPQALELLLESVLGVSSLWSACQPAVTLHRPLHTAIPSLSFFTPLQNQLQHDIEHQFLGSLGHMLLCGDRGAFKEHVLDNALRELDHVLVLWVLAPLLSGTVQQILDGLHALFRLAVVRGPTCVVLEDIDGLCPRGSAQDTFMAADATVATAVTGARAFKASEISLCTQRFKKVAECNELSGEDVSQLAEKTDGYQVADLVNTLDRVRLLGDLNVHSINTALRDFAPAKFTQGRFLESDVMWHHVGGLESLQQMLVDTLTLSTTFHAVVKNAPIRTRQGILLMGPSGCGKTFIVHALAHKLRGYVRFLSVKGPELLSKYIGASEAGVRSVFANAQQVAPSAIFFDEIESLCPKRGADSTGVTDRVVNQMLTYLDGVEERKQVFVIAASSRPDLIDSALLRPGRLDKHCFLGIPSSEEKKRICEQMVCVVASSSDEEGTTGSNGTKNRLHPDGKRFAREELPLRAPALFTGADFKAVFSSATIAAVHDSLANNNSGGVVEITERHLANALREAKPSISELDQCKNDAIFAPFLGKTVEKMTAHQKVALM